MTTEWMLRSLEDIIKNDNKDIVGDSNYGRSQQHSIVQPSFLIKEIW